MADMDKIINKTKFDNEILISEEIKDNPKSVKSIKEIRDEKVQTQLHALFKKKQREKVPSPNELKNLINKYFNDIYPENYALYTLHIYIGMTEENIDVHILANDELKEIYEFAIEKFKAKGEIMLHVAGRSADSFYMQNIAKWRKKDLEEIKKTSGLAELHKSMRDYKKNKVNSVKK